MGPLHRHHFVRDGSFAEDASRIRCNPGIFARLRSFAANILRFNGIHNVSDGRHRIAFGGISAILAMRGPDADARALQRADRELAPGGGRQVAPVSADQKYLRYMAMLAYTTAKLQQAGIRTPLDMLSTIADIERLVGEVAWDQERDLASYNAIKDQPFGTLNVNTADDAAEPFVDRLPSPADDPPKKRKYTRRKRQESDTQTGGAGNGPVE